MDIAYLADYPEHLTTVARWQDEQWAHLSPERTLKDRIHTYRESMNRDELPMALVAVERDQVLGTASLTIDEMASHTELNPWLASVFVSENHRSHGVAKALVARLLEEARRLGHEELFLFTYDGKSFYERFGFEELAEETYRGRRTTLMRCEL